MAFIISIIFLFICFSLSAASNGDYSGIKAIGSIVGIGAAIMLFLLMMLYVPWIFGVGVILLIVYSIISSLSDKKKNNQINTSDITETLSNVQEINDSQVNDEPIINNNLLGFKTELQKNTKTNAQILSDKLEYIYAQAHLIYGNIKKICLRKAETGEYSVENNQRIIEFDFKEKYFLDNSLMFSHFETVVKGKPHRYSITHVDTITCKLKNEYLFNSFMDEIRRLSNEDEINIIPVVVVENHNYESFKMPFTVRGVILREHEFHLILRCKIVY